MAKTSEIRRIGPVAITVGTVPAALATILGAINAHEAAIFGFCNAHTVNLARRDPTLAAAFAMAKIFNDGIGVDLASRLLHGRAFPANLNGTDLTPLLLSALSDQPRRKLFLLGSAPGVAEKAAAVIAERYPALDVVGARHGFFTEDESASLIANIRACDPDLVVVGMGQPRQEIWAAKALHRLDTVILCVGAFLDFISGKVSRAPVIIRHARLEWAYRLMIEPRRMAGRYLLGNARFLGDVLVEKVTPPIS